MKNTIIIMLTALLWISCSDDEKVNIKPESLLKNNHPLWSIPQPENIQ